MRHFNNESHEENSEKYCIYGVFERRELGAVQKYLRLRDFLL